MSRLDKAGIIFIWIVTILAIRYKSHLDAKEAEEKQPVVKVYAIERITPQEREEIIFNTDTQIKKEDVVLENFTVVLPEKGCLTASLGVFRGPSGKETWYNLPMGGVIEIMRNLGYSEQDYPYWVREDGCKMFGDYIMVAASLDIRPKGTILQTSLGLAMVCDTGEFAKTDQTQIDIATNW